VNLTGVANPIGTQQGVLTQVCSDIEKNHSGPKKIGDEPRLGFFENTMPVNDFSDHIVRVNAHFEPTLLAQFSDD